MADRVYPTDAAAMEKPSLPSPGKPVPPPGTYVIQIPKDQVFRVPPPENARRYNNLSKRRPRRSCCGRCCCCFISAALFLILAAAVSAAVFYFVFKPESPKYTVESVSIKGFNLTSRAPISPEFDVAVRATNPNDRIGIFYEKGSSVKIDYTGTTICNGVLPVFYQPQNNVTVFKTSLQGSAVDLSAAAEKALLREVNEGTVPFNLRIRAPVKIKVGSVNTWKITIKVTCKITVDKLTASSKILSKDCSYGVDLW